MRCYAEHGYARVSRPSVCPSVMFRYVFHTGWNTLKIISQLTSWRFWLGLTPTPVIWSNGNNLKIWVE